MTRHAEECWSFYFKFVPSISSSHLESFVSSELSTETKMLAPQLRGPASQASHSPVGLCGTCLFRPASSGGVEKSEIVSVVRPAVFQLPTILTLWHPLSASLDLCPCDASPRPILQPQSLFPAFLFHFQTAAVSWNTAMPLLQREGLSQPPSSPPPALSPVLTLSFSQVHPLRSLPPLRCPFHPNGLSPSVLLSCHWLFTLSSDWFLLPLCPHSAFTGICFLVLKLHWGM